MTNYIKVWYSKKTMLIATHKPSLLHLVDRVIIVVDGKVVADGPRDQILEQYTQRKA